MKVFDAPVILLLRQHGFDVRSVSEEFPSKEDEFVLESANMDDRVLVTSDKDFGELVYRLKKTSKGVILLRIEELLLKVIRDRKDELLNSFIVIRKGMVRIRRM